jgi:transcriptional regulator of acetoin/glycerol metabolism
MGNPAKILAGPPQWGGPPDRASDSADDARLAQAAHNELVTMGMPRVNVLLAGRDGAVRQTLESLIGRLREPIASWCPGERLALPSTEADGTMILHDVERLGLEDQIHLLEWLGTAAGRVQVVSTTAGPLFPRVSAGAFIDTLYYRLNTVYLELSA